MSESPRILIVSDNAGVPRAALEQRGFELAVAKDVETAWKKLCAAVFDLVVIAAGPQQDGIEFIRRVRAGPQITGILILVLAEWGTGEPTLALSAGADAYEPTEGKAIDPKRLITSIERLLGRQVSAAN